MKTEIKILLIVFIFAIGTTYSQLYTKDGTVRTGTPSPFHQMHLKSNSVNFTLLSGEAPGILFSNTSTSSLALPAIGLATDNTHYHNSSVSGDFNIRSGAGRDILLGTLSSTSSTNGTERMRIKNNGDIIINNGKLELKGNKGLLFSDFGGGFKMVDNSWIRTSGNKSFYHNRGIMRTDGTFQVGPAGNRFIVKANGDIGIGVSNTNGYKLAVNGNIIAEELKIRTFDNWPDYVFAPDYHLISLKEVEDHIQKEGHLPNIPPAKEIKENGIHIGEMNAKLLEKIEELTLYIITINKKVEALKKQNDQLKKIVGK